MKKPTTILKESVSEYREFVQLRLRKRVLPLRCSCHTGDDLRRDADIVLGSESCPPYCLSFGNICRARSMRWRSMSWNAASRLRSSMCSVIAERITCEIG